MSTEQATSTVPGSALPTPQARVSHAWYPNDPASEEAVTWPTQAAPYLPARYRSPEVHDDDFAEFRRTHASRLAVAAPLRLSYRKAPPLPPIGLAVFVDIEDATAIAEGADTVRRFLADAIFRADSEPSVQCRYALPDEILARFDAAWEEWVVHVQCRLAPEPSAYGPDPRWKVKAAVHVRDRDFWLERFSDAFVLVGVTEFEPDDEPRCCASVLHIAVGPDRISVRIGLKTGRQRGHVWEPNGPIELRLGGIIRCFERTASAVEADTADYEEQIYDDIAGSTDTDVRTALKTSRQLLRLQRDVHQRLTATLGRLDALDTPSQRSAFSYRIDDRERLDALAIRAKSMRDDFFTLQEVVVSSGAWEQAETLRRLQDDARRQAERTGAITQVVSALAVPSVIIGALSTSVLPWSHGSWPATVGMFVMASLCGLAAFIAAGVWVRRDDRDTRGTTPAVGWRRHPAGIATLCAVVGVVAGVLLIGIGAAEPGVDTPAITIVAPTATHTAPDP
jgi:hypothetical protein